MSTRRMEADLFGRETTFEYSETWVGYALVGLRVVMGWTFFYAGITKVLDPTWSARGFLLNAIPEGNPFGGVWATMAEEWLWLIDPLNAWGLTLVGLGLLLGVLVRWSAFWGAVMMLFYWAASLPLANGLVIDDHVVYALLLFGLGAFGATDHHDVCLAITNRQDALPDGRAGGGTGRLQAGRCDLRSADRLGHHRGLVTLVFCHLSHEVPIKERLDVGRDQAGVVERREAGFRKHISSGPLRVLPEVRQTDTRYAWRGHHVVLAEATFMSAAPGRKQGENVVRGVNGHPRK